MQQGVTVLLICNMYGSGKKKPILIGTSKSPRCFKGIKHLPVNYYSNCKAWMTSTVFKNVMLK